MLWYFILGFICSIPLRTARRAHLNSEVSVARWKGMEEAQQQLLDALEGKDTPGAKHVRSAILSYGWTPPRPARLPPAPHDRELSAN